jgi:hypothetical protein
MALVPAPDFCVEPTALSKRPVSEQDADEADASLVTYSGFSRQ